MAGIRFVRPVTQVTLRNGHKGDRSRHPCGSRIVLPVCPVPTQGSARMGGMDSSHQHPPGERLRGPGTQDRHRRRQHDKLPAGHRQGA
jgi:hypothetical protein